MYNFKFIFAGLVAISFFACSSTQVGTKENWIDERDVMALANIHINTWMQSVGRPSLVEINGDTVMYYYNYRPTLHATTVYEDNQAKEIKPSINTAVEVWGSRKNLMQIKVVNNVVVSALVFEGPDKKTYVRDLNGDLVLDVKSGFQPNYSAEQVFNNNYNEFVKAYSNLHSQTVPLPAAPVATATEASAFGLGSAPAAEATTQSSEATVSEPIAVQAPPEPEIPLDPASLPLGQAPAPAPTPAPDLAPAPAPAPASN